MDWMLEKIWGVDSLCGENEKATMVVGHLLEHPQIFPCIIRTDAVS